MINDRACVDWATRKQPCHIWFTATMLQDSKTNRFQSKELILTVKKEVRIVRASERAHERTNTSPHSLTRYLV